MKAIGMNTKGLLCPRARMKKSLKDSMHEGLLRLEITFTADSRMGEDELFDPDFTNSASNLLNLGLQALDNVNGITWHIPVRDLLSHFQMTVKGHQLLLVQETVAAMIYASNEKNQCYTGFIQKLPLHSTFDYMSFLAAQALPGTGSVITCIFQPFGPMGSTRCLVFNKQTNRCQIPGLKYRNVIVQNDLRPHTWDDSKMSSTAIS